MTAWILVALLVVWIFLAAIVLVSLCMMSSRFNRAEQAGISQPPMESEEAVEIVPHAANR